MTIYYLLEEFKYTGKHQDATGLYYFGARYYDPETGRFITKDLVKGSLADPQSLNRYTYCRNNPHKYTDPDGKIFVPWLLNSVVGAVIGAGVNALFYSAQNMNNRGTKEFSRGFMKAAITGAVSGAISGAVSTAIITKAAGQIASKTVLNTVGKTVGNLMATGASTITAEVYDIATGANSENLLGHWTRIWRGINF